MPIITIEASKSLSKETKKQLIEDVSKTLSDEFEIPIQSITTVIRDNSPDNIGDGGKQVSDI